MGHRPPATPGRTSTPSPRCSPRPAPIPTRVAKGRRRLRPDQPRTVRPARPRPPMAPRPVRTLARRRHPATRPPPPGAGTPPARGGAQSSIATQPLDRSNCGRCGYLIMGWGGGFGVTGVAEVSGRVSGRVWRHRRACCLTSVRRRRLPVRLSSGSTRQVMGPARVPEPTGAGRPAAHTRRGPRPRLVVQIRYHHVRPKRTNSGLFADGTARICSIAYLLSVL